MDDGMKNGWVVRTFKQQTKKKVPRHRVCAEGPKDGEAAHAHVFVHNKKKKHKNKLVHTYMQMHEKRLWCILYKSAFWLQPGKRIWHTTCNVFWYKTFLWKNKTFIFWKKNFFLKKILIFIIIFLKFSWTKNNNGVGGGTCAMAMEWTNNALDQRTE